MLPPRQTSTEPREPIGENIACQDREIEQLMSDLSGSTGSLSSKIGSSYCLYDLLNRQLPGRRERR